MRRNTIKLNKEECSRKYDPKWIKDTASVLLDIDIGNLTEKQIKILRDLYFENMREGLNPKAAMKKAFNVVSCFD